MKIQLIKNRFVISCGFADNHLVKGMPSVRFDRRKMVWVAQNLNRNCQYMLDKLREYLDPELVATCESTLAKSKVVYSPFPSWYKFKTAPYEKQREALDKCYNLDRFALFMGMGSGKTKVAIDIFSAHLMNNKIKCWVVFAPVNVKSTWTKKQIPLHMPIDVPVFVAPEGNKSKSLKLAAEIKKLERFILVVGIESMSVGEKKGSAYELVRDCIIGREYGITVDESHLAKSHDSTRSKNIKHLSEGAKVCCIMTGTPMSQGPIDLYMQFEILSPHILGFGDYYSFRARYAVMGGYENKQIESYQNLPELMDLITPFVYQCSKDDVVDLPPKIYEPLYIKLTPEQERVYKEIDKSMKLTIPTDAASLEVYVEHAVVKYGMLQQVVGGFVNYDEATGEVGKERKTKILVDPLKNPKILELIRIVEENPSALIVVWAKYRIEIEMIKEALEAKFGGGCCSEYHGGIPKDDRDHEEAKFITKQTRFMLSNQQTGGTGTTWIQSEIAFYYSNGFRMIDREQSEDRNHRIGTTNRVVYFDVIAEGTVDEDIIRSIETKKDLAQYIRDGIKTRLHPAASNGTIRLSREV